MVKIMGKGPLTSGSPSLNSSSPALAIGQQPSGLAFLTCQMAQATSSYREEWDTQRTQSIGAVFILDGARIHSSSSQTGCTPDASSYASLTEDGCFLSLGHGFSHGSLCLGTKG